MDLDTADLTHLVRPSESLRFGGRLDLRLNKTVDALRRLSPTPPAWIWLTGTAWPSAAAKASTSRCRLAGGIEPVSGEPPVVRAEEVVHVAEVFLATGIGVDLMATLEPLDLGAESLK